MVIDTFISLKMLILRAYEGVNSIVGDKKWLWDDMRDGDIEEMHGPVCVMCFVMRYKRNKMWTFMNGTEWMWWVDWMPWTVAHWFGCCEVRKGLNDSNEFIPMRAFV